MTSIGISAIQIILGLLTVNPGYITLFSLSVQHVA